MRDLAQQLRNALADRYRIERELGRGGMATVYLAEDLKHHRPVALKVLDREVAAAVGPERFLREIETVAKLNHPHILTLHDSGAAAGSLFYVMPYVTGESLRQRLERERQLPLEEALRITREVADALEHAHGQGVVHRDIKPENILLQGGHAVVADFGIARAVAVAGGAKLTATGVAIGTPAYMSPEQVAGGSADRRSDIYGLGCVLYEMLAGEPPFTGPSAESLVFQHLNAAPPHVSAMRPAVTAGLDQAITRALAKTPADRYASASEFAAALTAEGAPVPKHRVLRTAPSVAGVVLALMGVAAWQHWWPFTEKSAAPPAKRDWILVADFDGPPGDSTLAPAAKSLLSAALDQSQIVATVPPNQIREALVAAGKPRNARLDGELAQELAYRSSVRAVLEGTIARLGKGYSIVLKVADADTPRVLLTRSGTAKDEDDLIPALGEMAKQLRRGLGENRQALKATRPMKLVLTPSFEAYRLMVQAQGMFSRQVAIREALRLTRAALALDPNFAQAWVGAATCYGNLGDEDSARICREEALRHPERLTAGQRRRLEARLARDADDRLSPRDRLLARVAELDQMLEEDPGNAAAWFNSNDPLCGLGRFEEALERTRRAMQLAPFGPSAMVRDNEATDLRWLGRFDEAREASRHTGAGSAWNLAYTEMAAERFAPAESIATAKLYDPRVNFEAPGGFRWVLASAQFGRGAVGAAVKTCQDLEGALRGAAPAKLPSGLRYTGVKYSVLSDGAFALPADTWAHDTLATMLIDHGLRAAVAGDPALARRCLEAARARPARELASTGAGPALVEARVALLAGRPEEAVRLLRPLAVERVEIGASDGVGLTWVRWALADAYERLSQPDSAVVYLERVWSIPFREGEAKPYVHRRLALLYARMGRLPEAERHLAAVERAWDRPDPAIRRMLAEARAAVGAARSMARPASLGG